MKKKVILQLCLICLQKSELYSSLCQQLSFSAQSLLDDIWCRLYSTSRVLQISTKDFWYIYEHLVKKKYTCIFEHIHGSSPIQCRNLKSYFSVQHCSKAFQKKLSFVLSHLSFYLPQIILKFFYTEPSSEGYYRLKDKFSWTSKTIYQVPSFQLFNDTSHVYFFSKQTLQLGVKEEGLHSTY